MNARPFAPTDLVEAFGYQKKNQSFHQSGPVHVHHATKVMTAIDEATILLDHERRILAANCAAETLMNSDRVCRTQENRLVLGNRADHVQFLKTFSSITSETAAEANPDSSDGSICIAHGLYGEVTALKLRQVRLEDRDRRKYFAWVHVSLCDWQKRGKLDTRPLAIEFELTATEQDLVAHLADGGLIDTFAKSRNIAVSTARWHLKNAEAKTGTSRAEQLVALACQCCFRTQAI